MTSRPTESLKSPLKAWLRAIEMTAPIERTPTRTLPLVIDELAERFTTAPALLSADATLTYQGLAQASRRYARWAIAQGLTADDVVCLLMPNCPDYMAIWLGLTRIGITVSLLNTHLTGALLAHSINVVTPRYVIFDARYGEAFHAARADIPASIQGWSHGPGDCGYPRLDQAAEQHRADALAPAEYQLPTLSDRALYIYTSGTTGLPKAAQVSHFRLMQWSHWFAGMMDTQPSDRMYDCLPLYHSVGGVVATGATLIGGGAVVLRERFSAREFWRDLVEQRCTLFQYIGELCRYLANSPSQPDETRHALRLCCGNGLRAEVWETFKTRFAIPQILEYYAATEGTFSLYNCEGRPGAIGRIPPFLSHRLAVELVQFDLQSGAPVRSESGQCLRCEPNEVGEAIGKIVETNAAASNRFEGYADPEATKQKILRDVFASGDAWYRTGDLMRRDEKGFFFFVDRVGDTYRWKGENVSTTQVSAVLSAITGVVDAVVYGVTVPTAEGRAGMSALVVNTEFNLEHFTRSVTDHLPGYARPLFLRIVAAIDVTDTFKMQKQKLSREGYNPADIADELYVYDTRPQAYVSLKPVLYEGVLSGTFRL